MATTGNNSNMKVAQARDEGLKSFDKEYLDVLRGGLINSVDEYVNQKKYCKKMKELDREALDGKDLLEIAQELDAKTLTGELSAGEIESIMVAYLDSIEDIQMYKEEEPTL